MNREKHVITIEEEVSDPTGGWERVLVTDGNMPEWARVLEPVRKLPTNVGTRIRKCVYEALERNPPDWAKRILERSISKEVYKGNASGPTKVLFYLFSTFYLFSCFYLIIDCLMVDGRNNYLWEDKWLEIDPLALCFLVYIIYIFCEETLGGFFYFSFWDFFLALFGVFCPCLGAWGNFK